MKLKVLLALLMLFLLYPAEGQAAGKIERQNTAILTVTADVPNDFDRNITVKYKVAGDTEWVYEFVLSPMNGFKVSQRVEQGIYQCAERTAVDCTVSLEEALSVYSDYDLLVSVTDNRTTTGVQVQPSRELPVQTEISYSWVKFTIGGLILVGILAIFIVIKKG